MDFHLSSSNVKICGIPVLPPLITNDIATEIQYYKQLSLAVEERLRILESARKAAFEKTNYELVKDDSKILVPHDDLITDLPTKLENNKTMQDMASAASTIMNYSTTDKVENLIDMSTPIEESKSEKSINNDIFLEPKQKPQEQIDKSISDVDKSGLNETLLGDSICSDTITVSTDLNHYLNTSISKTDSTETTPENWKPQVPKTLDIVPITLDQSKPSEKSDASHGETPKLVRRGSYVLDSPSPMLLAHIQNELSNTVYTPTSAQSPKRKEWNINQSKTEWKTPSNFKEPISTRVNSASKLRKMNHSSIPGQRNCKSVSNSKTGSPLDVYQPAKSADCIQTMFAKECYLSKTGNKPSNQNHKYSSSVNGTNGIKNNSSKKPCKNISIVNLANKMSESLGSLSNRSPKPVKRVEKKTNNTNLNKSTDCNSAKSNDLTDSSKNQKSVITSEKIVTVFKDIQDTHKKQIVELMSRQQKEQLLLQENFKKQQILLLAQIRKAFPEISLSDLTEAITGKNTEQTPVNSKAAVQKFGSTHSQKEDDKPQLNGLHHQDENQTPIKLPTDYSHASKESSSAPCHLTTQPTPTVTSYYQDDLKSTRTLDESPSPFTSRVQLSNFRDIDDIPVGTPLRRHSSVSRQLFPLDSKANHIIDNSMYTDKHIKAATIINAYAKGFLVRRLMKTEKIIALKNTYREALHCMLRLHVDAPLNLPELNFHQRLQLQCDAASMNIVDLFSQSPTKQMEIIAHDREIKRARTDRPSSARSFSFATQRTLARKKLKEMGGCSSLQCSMMTRSCPARTRCQTWTSSLNREKKITTSLIHSTSGMKRSTSAGAVRKPWR